MIEDRSFLRPDMRAAIPAGVTSAGGVLIELHSFALRTLRIREASLEEIGKASVVIGELLFEVEDGEARHTGRGRMPTGYSSSS